MANDIGRIAIAFGMALGLNTGDFSKLLIDELKKACKVPWRFKTYLMVDLFAWVWAIGEYYSTQYLLNQGMEKESFLFKEILKSYLEVTAKGKNEYEIYGGYRNYIIEIANMDRDTYYKRWGLNYDERVEEKLVNMLSLRILGLIKPRIKLMNADEINTEYEMDLSRIRGHVEMIFNLTLGLVNHYLREADQAEIEKAFSAVRTNPLIQKVLKHLEGKF